MPEVILLAAGKSQRFGQSKLIQQLNNGKEIICQCIDVINQAGYKPNVIIRQNDLSTKNILLSQHCEVFEFSNASMGMGSSIAYAVEKLLTANAWVICLADMPYLQSSTIKKVCGSLKNSESLCAAFYQDKQGHPVGFGRNYFDELVSLSGDTGAKKIIQKHKSNLRPIYLSDPGIVKDIDTPEQLSELV